MTVRLPALALLVLALSSQAVAADRNFTVTGFDRIRIDGPFMVRVTTGVPPSAKASGSPAAINGVSVEVQGQTLVVRKSPGSWGGYSGQSVGPVEIAVSTHELSMAWLNGAGRLAIDKVKGQTFELSIQGPGSISVGRLSVDQLKAGLSGSGSAAVGGSAAMVTAVARGTSTFDGSTLTAKDVTIGADGGSVVKLTVTNTAKIDSVGTAMVKLTGGPACTIRALGSAVVSGCR